MRLSTSEDGAGMICIERNRQINECGWDDSHDDQHTDGTLAVVAAILAVDGTDANVDDPCGREDCWGLQRKHPDRKKQLVIAGALIAAEIDRLLRLEAPIESGAE